jgi:outer membrane protein assembly factor BamB
MVFLTEPNYVIARPLPSGAAAPDGSALYLRGPAGLEEIDPATGGFRWSSPDGELPLLVTSSAVIALRASISGDRSWSGSAALVAIDRAPPHAARATKAFVLPEVNGELGPVWIEGGMLHARWAASGPPRGIAPRSQPVSGSLKVALDAPSGAEVAIEIGAPDPAPADVIAALDGVTVWTRPWRTAGGWSALIVITADGGSAAVLRHWPSGGGAPRDTVVADAIAFPESAPLAADATDVFVRVCTPDGTCALHVHAADGGPPIATLPQPRGERLDPPMGRVGRLVLAVRGDALLAVDLDTGEVRWQRSRTPPPPPVKAVEAGRG